MEYAKLYYGDLIPVIGQGTWGIGGGMSADPSNDNRSLQAIRDAIELGYTHIDTAEMYGGGHTEELVGQVIGEYDREDLFIATKVWNVTQNSEDTLRAFEGSLRWLKTDYVDLYLIHRPNLDAPLEAAFMALNMLVMQGKIRHLGVSNFNLHQFKRAQALSDTPLVTNQVPYNLHKRTYAENGVLDYCQDKDVLLTAYSPIDRGYLVDDPVLVKLAKQYDATPAQIALAWLIRQPNVIALPMSTQKRHLEENLGALELDLALEDMQRLDNLELHEDTLFPE